MSWLAILEADSEAILAHGLVDSYACHQRLWECFPGEPDHERDFLSRIDPLEGSLRLWVMAQRKPNRPDWCSEERFAVKEIASSFLAHRYYAFDLRANPTKCISVRKADGSLPRHGKRVPLHEPDELRTWVDRKGEKGGFRIVAEKPLEIGPMVENHFRKKGRSGYHGGVRFRGTLAVTDPVKFAETYHAGLGSGKCFGFGLLLLTPLDF